MFLRYAQPQDFANAPDGDQQRYGGMLDRYYASVDAQVGAAVERLAPGDLLLVISGFGMQPVGSLEHALGRILRDPDVSGSHQSAPDGFLLAYGSSVQPGRKQRGSIVDVTPTILYYLGLPVGRDMDGYARADLFGPALTASRPITFIPSHGR
jgi:predicted AlkP superfamily phosphohydrolase/phosphomutase